MKMHTIENLKAREIIDSRGNPTVEVDLWLKDGSFGRAAVPSGASTGSHEAIELRDGEKRYKGKGVQKAVLAVNEEILTKVKGLELNQQTLDKLLCELDGTENKGRLGANALLGVSLAFSHAAAQAQQQPLYHYFAEISEVKRPLTLPVPLMNILNGGKHAEQSADFQEFMIVPSGAATFKEALRYGVEVFHSLKSLLGKQGFTTAVGDEGGFAPSLKNNEAALQLIIQAIEQAGFKAGEDIKLALDVAATELYEQEHYYLKSENRQLSREALIELYGQWVEQYPIFSIEDALAEDDWQGYQLLTEKLGKKVQLVGDDLFVTNVKRLAEGIEKKTGNAILVKLNQIGTVWETIEVVKMAYAASYRVIISHRSGETEDTSIADLAVGLGAGQIKTGSLSRSERTAKYNQLMRIEEELGEKAHYAKLN